MKKINFTEAFSLMDKCIQSCDSSAQLEVMFEFIDTTITEERFPEQPKLDVLGARSLFFKAILDRKDAIDGIGDLEEVDLKSGL